MVYIHHDPFIANQTESSTYIVVGIFLLADLLVAHGYRV